ncbi:MBOAT, membrane-bound O-acyltransferase family protein [[Clostridium] bifermentans ATCC 638]|uniref:MBOAT, membrane-bound O-acyltransferase family protein n=1 Tax=Paraclostridium bifermentans ATCC 638 = DSM 14991 TaxID=1233171 RepID=T4VS52_PARBF|nr:MBOAT family O-acyltransferase [Paraclostridium bifermentans]EQK43945.1 MBOAT, membrane-bound O-acyltransferase family protein [[Clostridium] bifermentans ATCC 638] [Paraclostridium bifermentans ATCC 638 = DSM 14991]RIZ59364.1 MBOAT family protein [Paraclostridium bifermentans]UAG17768.1 MBOAT family protein [Paraclostridium bifermentans]
MVFNSFQFIVFFPIVTLIYFIIPSKLKWIWLLITSYYFYMSWDPRFAILILISTVITYFSGILIEKANCIENVDKRKKNKKICVGLSFTLNLGILVFFKYFNFILDNINFVLEKINISMIVPQFDVLLPVGISFYTFQALSYTMDVYRGDVEVEHNLGKYALFVSFFPQLVAGPIERSRTLLNQFNKDYSFDYERVKNGLQLMIWGMFQKMVIADRLAIIVNNVFNNYKQYNGLEIIIAVVLFAIQIYCDFSSYSDIAIGSAQVLGFKLMKNFDTPYFSQSIAEFWRRWHISLGTWFKDYLYIPLGGNRKGKLKNYRNIMIVFLASGLWHGASWNFVIWGFLHGIYQVIGKIMKPFRDRAVEILSIDRSSFGHRLYKVIVTFILVDFAWIFFRAPTLRDSMGIIKKMFYFDPWILIDGSIYNLGLDQNEIKIVIISLLILFLVGLMKRSFNIREKINRQGILFRWIIYYVAIFSILILGVYGPGFSAQQFIYFQF